MRAGEDQPASKRAVPHASVHHRFEAGCPFRLRFGSARDKFIRFVPRFRIIPAAYAFLRGTLSKHPLPPGELVSLDSIEKANRCFLLDQFERVGPIFKAVSGRRLQVCILGIPRGRQFLKDHSDGLTPLTVNLESLFPKGFLRKMHGEEHRKYRQALVRAIDPALVGAHKVALEEMAVAGLKRYVTAQSGDLPAAYIRALNGITSGMLIQLFFGAPFRSAAFESLMERFHQLGPNGLEWFIGPHQKNCYREIRDFLLQQVARPEGAGEPWLKNSILGRMSSDGALDETSLGQLIYMVEMGRFDMYSLFRWLTKYAANYPALLDRIAGEVSWEPSAGTTLAEAFVLETLRLDQSERLMRAATRDLVFEGYLIPRFSSVRLCLWEAHKSSDAFPDPFGFNPARFLGNGCSPDEYSPFGLDHHNCPLADITIQLSTIFIRTLATQYTLEAIGDGPAVRGRYHWQPAKEFTVRLRKR